MGGDCPPTSSGDREQVMRGADRGAKNLWGEGGTLAYRNQISVKSVFACSTHNFHKNICFTVCLNSAGFFDSALVNIGC